MSDAAGDAVLLLVLLLVVVCGGGTREAHSADCVDYRREKLQGGSEVRPHWHWQHGWCRGGELNSLRRPFQGRALPVSYPGTGAVKDSTGAMQGCQLRNGFRAE